MLWPDPGTWTCMGPAGGKSWGLLLRLREEPCLWSPHFLYKACVSFCEIWHLYNSDTVV